MAYSVPRVATTFLIEEVPTDGHSPLKFITEDEDVYFCKYRVNNKEQELSCLIYEVVCSLLLKPLGIPTPKIESKISTFLSNQERIREVETLIIKHLSTSNLEL